MERIINDQLTADELEAATRLRRLYPGINISMIRTVSILPNGRIDIQHCLGGRTATDQFYFGRPGGDPVSFCHAIDENTCLRPIKAKTKKGRESNKVEADEPRPAVELKLCR